MVPDPAKAVAVFTGLCACWCCGDECAWCWPWDPCPGSHWCSPCKYGGRTGDGCLCGWRPGSRESFAWIGHLPDDARSQFFAELPDAINPQRDSYIISWRATAEIYAEPGLADRLTQAIVEADEGKATPWEYDADD